MDYLHFSKTSTKTNIEQFIKKANDAYYNTGKPIISDKLYDQIIDIVKKRFPDSKIINQIGAPIRSEIEKVSLPYWMGSMDKVKPNSKSLELWLNKYHYPYVISEKLDGLSGLLVYNLNSNNSINLYTRGNGFIGQNISHLVPFLKLNSKNILENIGNKILTIRGEFIMKKDVFKKKYAKDYPKARSLISGLINAKKPNVNILKDIDFVGYELILEKERSISIKKQLIIINRLGFKTVNYKLVNSELNSDILTKTLIDFKDKSLYEIDGIIISDNNENKRNKSGNPKYAVAFKSQLDEQIAITTVENVEYNPSKHGTLIPRIKLKPVVIGGDTITYTTGFNAKFIKDNKIGVGSKLKIIRSGDVIPYIMDILEPSKDGKWQQPSIKRDEWKWGDTGVDIELINKSSNKNVKIKSLLHFFKTLQIVGVSEGLITRFVEHGFDTIKKIYNMTVTDLLSLPSIKEKMANKIHTNIHKIIDNEILVETLMTASNVFKGGLAEKKLIVIVEKYPKFMSQSLTENDIIQCEGFSSKTSKAFLKGLGEFKLFLQENPFLKYNIKKPKKTKNGKYKDQFIVMTGFRDKNLEAKLESLGAVIQSGLNSKTTLVIAKDINSSSSKLKKAKEMNIKIVKYDLLI